jgi:hypothetical protein
VTDLTYFHTGFHTLPPFLQNTMEIRYTMFQAMIEDVDVGVGGLKTVWARCLRLETDGMMEVYACVPGSLKQRVDFGSAYQVGSLHVKTTCPNVSLLMFANGKVKCSGSYRELDTETQTAEGFVASITRPVLNAMGIDFDDSKLSIRLLNAGFALHTMNEWLYFNICNEIRKHYDTVVLPATMTGGVRPRGRFCALKIYVNGVRPGPSLHFDHKGKVQAFAFRSVSDIHSQTQRLSEVVERIRAAHNEVTPF